MDLLGPPCRAGLMLGETIESPWIHKNGDCISLIIKGSLSVFDDLKQNDLTSIPCFESCKGRLEYGLKIFTKLCKLEHFIFLYRVKWIKMFV